MAVLGGKTKIKINHKTRFLLNNGNAKTETVSKTGVKVTEAFLVF